MGSIARDVTEPRRAEDALAAAQRQIQSIIDNTPAIVYAFDLEERFLMANIAIAKLLDSTPERMIGKRRHEFMPKEDADWHEANDRQVIEVCRALEFEEYSQLKGRSITWLTTKFPLRDTQGRIYAVAGISADISERKLTEEVLKEAKQEAELYLDLMGHDINNMHQIALGYLELSQGLPPGVQQEEMIEKSIEMLQRSTQLIQNVGKLQRLNEGLLQMHEVDVGVLLHAVQREFGAVPGKNVRLNLNSDGHYYIRANELLYDVFANLVGNAIKHTGGKADIDISLDVIDDNDDRFCQVRVDDNGPGIPNEFKVRIFNRVLNGSSKTKGMGLGLYLVKSLVDSYDGRVWVEDRVPGDYTKGARFVVMLPTIKD